VICCKHVPRPPENIIEMPYEVRESGLCVACLERARGGLALAWWAR
jgi:hypothetical protein